MLGEVKKLHGHLMASFVKNIRTKNYRNLVICFHVTVENVGDFLGGHGVGIFPKFAILLLLTCCLSYVTNTADATLKGYQ